MCWRASRGDALSAARFAEELLPDLRAASSLLVRAPRIGGAGARALERERERLLVLRLARRELRGLAQRGERLVRHVVLEEHLAERVQRASRDWARRRGCAPRSRRRAWCRPAGSSDRRDRRGDADRPAGFRQPIEQARRRGPSPRCARRSRRAPRASRRRPRSALRARRARSSACFRSPRWMSVSTSRNTKLGSCGRGLDERLVLGDRFVELARRPRAAARP